MGQDLPGPCEAVTAPHPPSPCAFPPIAISSPGAELAPSPLRSNSWGLRSCSPNPSTRRVRAAASTGKHRAQAALKRQAPPGRAEDTPSATGGRGGVRPARGLPALWDRAAAAWGLDRRPPREPALSRAAPCHPGVWAWDTPAWFPAELGATSTCGQCGHSTVGEPATPNWHPALSSEPCLPPPSGAPSSPEPLFPRTAAQPHPRPDSKYQRNLRQT